jgi:hypothetical protein|tara:strand:+ start:954 stop:1478 length:525 start_codon:yes stop_codon:yes gene_type:complete
MTEKKVAKPKEETVLIKDLNLQQKIHLAVSLCGVVKKSQTGMGYSAGSYNDVQQICKVACQQARLNLRPRTKTDITDSSITMHIALDVIDIDKVRINENTGDFNDYMAIGDIAVTQKLKGNQNDAKASGSLFSYGYKYLLQKFFLLDIEESQDDIDFEQRASSSTSGFDLNKLK